MVIKWEEGVQCTWTAYGNNNTARSGRWGGSESRTQPISQRTGARQVRASGDKFNDCAKRHFRLVPGLFHVWYWV